MRKLASASMIPLFVMICVFVIASPTASAQQLYYDLLQNPTGGDPCEGTTDVVCNGSIGANAFYCSVAGSMGGYCVTVDETWNARTQRYEKRCAKAYYTASCQCDTSTFATKGYCDFKSFR